MSKIICLLLFLLSVCSVESKDFEEPSKGYIEMTQDMVATNQIQEMNTYYIIKETIDLRGNELIIPEGCTLKFEGGRLMNGSLVGTNTYIEATPYPLFANNILLSGSFIASVAYPEWFDSSDDAIKIRKALASFDNVKLTAKHYVLKSVDGDGYGIVVPSGRILQGNRKANNTNDNDQIIEMQRGVSYTAIIALSSNSMLQNLSINGENLYKSSSVATIHGFQSRLTLERVCVSGSYYGFNLQTYLTNLTQCIANYNDVGFFIHGSYNDDVISVEGTSINMSTCFAVDSKTTGYDISGITYSTLNNCAADGCGAPVDGLLDNNQDIGYAYSFLQSKNITINSCGAEYCLAAVKTVNCKNILFNAPSFLIAKRKNVSVANDFVLKNVINIRYSSYIVFDCMFFHTNIMSNYYNNNTSLMLLYGSESALPSAIVRKSYGGIDENNIKTEGFLNKAKNLVIY